MREIRRTAALCAFAIEVFLLPFLALVLTATCEEGTDWDESERLLVSWLIAATWLANFFCVAVMFLQRPPLWLGVTGTAALSWSIVAHVAFLIWITPEIPSRESANYEEGVLWYAGFWLVSVPIIAVCAERLLSLLFARGDEAASDTGA
jgi:hypothetical protein